MAHYDPGSLLYLAVIFPALGPALARSPLTEIGAAELAFDHSRNTIEAWT
jgi:hypothetical protein